jgi:hypothetical protein
VLETSRSHLKQQFRSHFETEEGKPDYFKYLDLSVKQYDVGGERHLAEYSMAILYHGVAYFNRAPPDKSLAYDIVAEAFQGDLREQFVTALLESKSPFLSQLQYIVVTINDLVVANDDLSLIVFRQVKIRRPVHRGWWFLQSRGLLSVCW